MYIPTVEGVLHALRLSRRGRQARGVSSFGDGRYGSQAADQAIQRDFGISEIFSERASWNLIAHEGGDLELSVVDPAAVFGPALGADHSLHIARRLLGIFECYDDR